MQSAPCSLLDWAERPGSALLPMAEKSSCRTLSSSIRSEDLLSDMELLPASGPTTPVQQVPCSQPATPYASKVTAQLYTSLHQSRQAEAQARSHLESQPSLGLARERQAPDVDLDALAEELSLRLSTSVEASKCRKGVVPVESHHISEMENVRCHLQSMLRKSRDAAHGEAADLGTVERKDNDSFESDSTGALLNARPLQEISPPGSLTGFEELFPRYTSLRLGQLRDQVSYADSHLLKDSLDKEQARRKHCERHIQTLQNRILELQQQLAVATTADKKKDSMIEQLDKTLAKVVEGWNRHEAERTAALQRLQGEKELAEQTLARQKEKLSETEGRLEQTLSALSREQQAASKYCKEKELLEEENATLLRNFEAEQLRVCSLEADRDLERRQQDALRTTLEEQQREWAQRERKLEQQYQALQDESQAQLEKEKAVAQQEAQKSLDTQRVLASVQSEMQRLEAELEAVRRERDNLKMEISLMKARYEAQKVKLESELKVALEQRVTERLAEVHEDSVRQMSTMREQHRKQLLEMSSHHEKELASQLDQFRSDLAEREERQRQLTQDYENRLSKQQEEILELRSTHRRLEVQRAEMVNQFQAMMQAHWNEALRLLAGSNASSQPCSKAPQQHALPDQPAPPDMGFLQPRESLKKTPKGLGPLGCSQGAGDCEGPPWTPAVPLHPVAQRSSSQGPSETPEKSTQDTCLPAAPLPPDMGRLSSEFSRILNCSLLSHQGFQQLEPQVDNTLAGAGLSFHLENLAERPFTDETDETATEGLGSDRESLRQSGPERGLQLSPADLNYYVRLLWDRTAQEGLDQKLEGFSMESRPHTTSQTQLGPSSSYHDWSTAFLDQSQPPASTVRIQPPSSAAVYKTKVPLPKPELFPSSVESASPPMQNAGQEGGSLSPKQMTEVSRLLKQCQAKGRPVPSAEELYKYLRGISHNGTDTKGDGTLQIHRNLDPRSMETTKKEVGSMRRIGSLGREKPHGSSKAGKRASGALVSNTRTSRGGGVWR